MTEVSVCLATYNGELWVREQLLSILEQLTPDDEVVVVDDASTDGTPDVVNSIGDSRIRLVRRTDNRGYVATFEEALRLARGRFLMLSDQDDVWPEGRVAILTAALERHRIVAGNMGLIGEPHRFPSPFGGRDWVLPPGGPARPRRMVLRIAACNAPYFGCAMAVRSDALDTVLPFPRSAREQHDAWLALIGLLEGSIAHVDERVVLRRIHDGNATGTPRDPLSILRGRLLFLGMLRDASRRVRSTRLSP